MLSRVCLQYNKEVERLQTSLVAIMSIMLTVKCSTFLKEECEELICRLKRKMASQGIPPIIKTTRYNQETAYYSDDTLPYTVCIGLIMKWN